MRAEPAAQVNGVHGGPAHITPHSPLLSPGFLRCLLFDFIVPELLKPSSKSDTLIFFLQRFARCVLAVKIDDGSVASTSQYKGRNAASRFRPYFLFVNLSFSSPTSFCSIDFSFAIDCGASVQCDITCTHIIAYKAKK